MLIAIGIVLLLILVFLPGIWTRYVFKRYNGELEQLPGTGGELAQHLINRFGLENVRVEETEADNDHYDPNDRAIRLSPGNFSGKSLTAVVVAAHEFGHALQHNSNYGPLILRNKLARLVALSEKIAAMFLVAFPFAALLTRLPAVGGIMLFTGVLILLLPVIFHLVTLPVELDASFNRALPLLKEGQYLPEPALPIARNILLAAAFTYLSSSLASVFNFYRWLIFLKR